MQHSIQLFFVFTDNLINTDRSALNNKPSLWASTIKYKRFNYLFGLYSPSDHPVRNYFAIITGLLNSIPYSYPSMIKYLILIGQWRSKGGNYLSTHSASAFDQFQINAQTHSLHNQHSLKMYHWLYLFLVVLCVKLSGRLLWLGFCLHQSGPACLGSLALIVHAHMSDCLIPHTPQHEQRRATALGGFSLSNT